MEDFLDVHGEVIMQAKYIKDYPQLVASCIGSNGWICTRGDESIVGLSESGAIAQLSAWYGNDLAAQAEGKASDVFFWKQNGYWLETHPIPDSRHIMYAERDTVEGNWFCKYGDWEQTRTSRIHAAILLNQRYAEVMGVSVPPIKPDQSIFVHNTDQYLEVLPIAPAPRMSALRYNDDDPIWECTRGDENVRKFTKIDAETLLFTWYCEARVKYDIFQKMAGDYMIVEGIDGEPAMYADIATDGVWVVHWDGSTLEQRPNRESAIDLLRAVYDTAIAAAKEQDDDARAQLISDKIEGKQALSQQSDDAFTGQPLTLTLEIEAKLRTAQYRSQWEELGAMHDDSGNQIGKIGLRNDGHFFVWLKSGVVGEFEYNINVGQFPVLLEEAVQAHHEGDPVQSASARDVITQIEHTLGLEVALAFEDNDLVVFCRNLLTQITEWQQTNVAPPDPKQGTSAPAIVQAVLDELELLKQKLAPREDKIWLTPDNDALVPYNKVFEVASQISNEKRVELAEVVIARIKHLQANIESPDPKDERIAYLENELEAMNRRYSMAMGNVRDRLDGSDPAQD